MSALEIQLSIYGSSSVVHSTIDSLNCTLTPKRLQGELSALNQWIPILPIQRKNTSSFSMVTVFSARNQHSYFIVGTALK